MPHKEILKKNRDVFLEKYLKVFAGIMIVSSKNVGSKQSVTLLQQIRRLSGEFFIVILEKLSRMLDFKLNCNFVKRILYQ